MMTELWRITKRSPELRIRLLALIVTFLAVLILIGMAIATLA
jgi:hypothetical protein